MFSKALLASVLAGLATAGPIEPRQFGRGGTGTTETQFTDQGCADVLFAFARGSTERGNMGSVVGPPTADALISEFGAENVRVEGIDYAAALAPNALPGGTDTQSKESMQNTLTAMSTQCPDSVIVAGGYSQGAAVNHRAIEELPANVQNQIAGVILYGDTQNQQDNGQIPNFPADKVNIICADGDLVCEGSLTIRAAHLSYGRNAEEGAAFLSQQIRGAQAAKKAKRDLEMAKQVKKVAKQVMA